MTNVVNLFKEAKEVSIGSPSTPRSSAKEAVEIVEMGSELTALASVKMLIKALSELADIHDAAVKSKMADEFARIAATQGKRPPNFKGVSDKAEATCQLRKRSGSSYLSSKELELLEAMEIPVEEKVICEAVPERYFFNPEIAASESLAVRISKALSGIPELKGMEVLIKQTAMEADIRKVVTEEAIDAVARIGDEKLIKELLPIVSTMAIRVKLTTPHVEEAIDILKRAQEKVGV